jgi:hypothetical protein
MCEWGIRGKKRRQLKEIDHKGEKYKDEKLKKKEKKKTTHKNAHTKHGINLSFCETLVNTNVWI